MTVTGELRELSRPECLSLLETARVGRVGVSVEALPAIVPVFITVLDDRIAFRCAPGAKLTAAAGGEIVAVEVDEVDAETGRGWSVLVRGVARELTDPGRLAAVRDRLGPSRFEEADQHVVEVTTDIVTGRRLG
ncbi:MAG: pyridoxamine 5'-phosphate oxidase family protein [Acidimicrobiia bacterium]